METRISLDPTKKHSAQMMLVIQTKCYGSPAFKNKESKKTNRQFSLHLTN
jgi:hypothetical protein